MTTQGIATSSPAAVALSARLRPIMIEVTAMAPDVPHRVKRQHDAEDRPEQPDVGRISRNGTDHHQPLGQHHLAEIQRGKLLHVHLPIKQPTFHRHSDGPNTQPQQQPDAPYSTSALSPSMNTPRPFLQQLSVVAQIERLKAFSLRPSA